MVNEQIKALISSLLQQSGLNLSDLKNIVHLIQQSMKRNGFFVYNRNLNINVCQQPSFYSPKTNNQSLGLKAMLYVIKMNERLQREQFRIYPSLVLLYSCCNWSSWNYWSLLLYCLAAFTSTCNFATTTRLSSLSRTESFSGKEVQPGRLYRSM
jgi:hypothetical protein